MQVANVGIFESIKNIKLPVQDFAQLNLAQTLNLGPTNIIWDSEFKTGPNSYLKLQPDLTSIKNIDSVAHSYLASVSLIIGGVFSVCQFQMILKPTTGVISNYSARLITVANGAIPDTLTLTQIITLQPNQEFQVELTNDSATSRQVLNGYSGISLALLN